MVCAAGHRSQDRPIVIAAGLPTEGSLRIIGRSSPLKPAARCADALLRSGVVGLLGEARPRNKGMKAAAPGLRPWCSKHGGASSGSKTATTDRMDEYPRQWKRAVLVPFIAGSCTCLGRQIVPLLSGRVFHRTLAAANAAGIPAAR